MSMAAAWPNTEVEGPAYPLALKSLATVLVAALCERGWRLLDAMPWTSLGTGGSGLLVAGLAVVAIGYLEIVASRTVVGTGSIRRRSFWSHEVRFEDIAQVKLVRVPGLDAVVVPRLVVRTRGLGIVTFRAGDARLLDAFRRLATGA